MGRASDAGSDGLGRMCARKDVAAVAAAHRLTAAHWMTHARTRSAAQRRTWDVPRVAPVMTTFCPASEKSCSALSAGVRSISVLGVVSVLRAASVNRRRPLRQRSAVYMRPRGARRGALRRPIDVRVLPEGTAATQSAASLPKLRGKSL